uniref:Protein DETOXIFICATION n=1 Tax=Araucaria cunninghamii TaxID=56994 RepID=A0A0D6R7Q9_ARACU
MEKSTPIPLLGARADAECDKQVPYLEDYDPTDYPRNHLGREIWEESKRLWSLALPVAVNRVSTYAFGVVTQAYAGNFGTLELAAVSLATSTIGGTTFGLMVGMSSALQTLSGQAFGAKQFRLLGIYMQRSFIVMNGTALLFTLLYIFTAPILKALGQSDRVADLTGQFALWSIPQLFAYANYFPVQKFLQSQRKVMMQAVICVGSLMCHAFLNWLLITKLGFGLFALAMALNASWWLVAVAQIIYVLSGAFPNTWTGFSLDAFHDVWSFLKLTVSSAVMACVESWYFRVLSLLTGNLRNPEISVDSFSICLSVYEGLMMFTSRAATSVIVSNELGAGRPKRTRFVILVCLGTTILCGIIFFVCVLAARNYIASFFTDNAAVSDMVSELSIFLAFTLLINSIQPVLTGVAVGAGWQSFVAMVNIACYYFIGVPAGSLLGLKFNLQVKGIWTGLMMGTSSQILILALTTYWADWDKEVLSAARNHLKTSVPRKVSSML